MRHRILFTALLTVTALASTACSRTVTSSSIDTGAGAPRVVSGGTVGASSGRASIELFMTAVKAQDLQAMSAVWGTEKGAARDQMNREELEKRLIIIQCLLTHDKWRFVEDQARLSTGGRQQFLVELTRGSNQAKTLFTAVGGPGGRWFMENVDVTPLREFCR